jgi:HD superfamily phosphohydrolase
MREEKVFKDPVHKYIYVQDQVIWDLINTAEFQRLRRIRQLGTSFLTFHGAEHSRFSHSLGVYEITRKIISQFERYQYEDWPKAERILCLCAALLHDLGHGPFSHSIESIFDTHHEQWTVQIVLGDTEIHRVLHRYDPFLPKALAEVIGKTYHHPIVTSLVSSQLDADRMDYLLRDAYFTGVNYGTFDLERILRVIRPYQGLIVIKESGMHAVEDYLMSRYQMYWQVYFHPVTRSAEILLNQIFKRVKWLLEQLYHFQFMPLTIQRLCTNHITLADYIQLDEAMIQSAFSYWREEKDPLLADLCDRFINRRLFKYIAMEQPSEEMVRKMTELVAQAGYDPNYYVQSDYSIDQSYDVYQPGKYKDKMPILLFNQNQERLIEISQQSKIVSSISGIHQGKHYFYYPGECWPLLQKEALC